MALKLEMPSEAFLHPQGDPFEATVEKILQMTNLCKHNLDIRIFFRTFARKLRATHKFIENNHVIIIKNGDKYDIVGKKL